MKKAIFLPIFLAITVFSFAVDLPSRALYIEGTAENPAFLTYFTDNFGMEAAALGFSVVRNKADAGYTFKFHVQNYNDQWDPANKYIILVSLLFNQENREIVSFGWPFSTLDDMYNYNQFVFYKAAVLIPGLSAYNSTDFSHNPAGMSNEFLTNDFMANGNMTSDFSSTANKPTSTKKEDDSWKNKWLYFRLSADYPITNYILQGDGLHKGKYIYSGSNIHYPIIISPMENKVLPQLGGTAGIEFQFLPFMSFEGNFQVFFGDTKDDWFFNMVTGAQLKFPLKFFKNYMIEPYGAFSYAINVSDVFIDFPKFFVGGGVQFGVKGGKSGAFFLDVNYMMPLPEFWGIENPDVVMHNPYKADWPNPAGIHYKRYVIGIGIGYKFGILDRK